MVQEKLQSDKTLVGMHQYSDRKPYGNANILCRNNICTIGFWNISTERYGYELTIASSNEHEVIW